MNEIGNPAGERDWRRPFGATTHTIGLFTRNQSFVVEDKTSRARETQSIIRFQRWTRASRVPVPRISFVTTLVVACAAGACTGAKRSRYPAKLKTTTTMTTGNALEGFDEQLADSFSSLVYAVRSRQC